MNHGPQRADEGLFDVDTQGEGSEDIGPTGRPLPDLPEPTPPPAGPKRAIIIALTFPIVLTTMYLGRPDPGVLFCGYLSSALLAGAYLAVGLFTSALTRNQVISFILSVVFGLFLILAGFPPVTDLLSRMAPAWLVEAVASVSFMPHY